MKILFCLNQDIFSNLALKFLSEILANNECYITLSSGVGHADKSLEKFKLLEGNLPYEILFPLTENRFDSFETLSEKYNAPLLEFRNINGNNERAKISELDLDLIISIRYGQIFREKIITIPKYGIFNLHSGMLPNYKGIMASFWAMLNGENKIGTTLHYVNDRTIDTGDIIDIAYIETHKNKSFFWHLDNLYEQGCAMLLKYVEDLQNGIIPSSTAQNPSEGNYYNYPKKTDIENFEARQFKLENLTDYKNILNKLVNEQR